MEQRTIRMPSGGVRRPAAGTLAALALVLVVGVLAGCESSASPPATTSPSAAASSASPSPLVTSPSPSASPSVEIPAAARVKSDKGAEAFVRYFFDQVNTAWTTANPELIAANSESGCKSCASLRDTAAELKAKKHKYASKPVTVKDTKSLAGAPAGQQFVEADLLQNRVDIVDASGRVVSTDKQDALLRTVGVIWKGDRWLIYDVA